MRRNVKLVSVKHLWTVASLCLNKIAAIEFTGRIGRIRYLFGACTNNLNIPMSRMVPRQEHGPSSPTQRGEDCIEHKQRSRSYENETKAKTSGNLEVDQTWFNSGSGMEAGVSQLRHVGLGE